MSTNLDQTRKLKGMLDASTGVEKILKDLSTELTLEGVPSLSKSFSANNEAVEERVKSLSEATNTKIPYITGQEHFKDFENLKGHVENFIGFAQVPIGVIGPLLLKGTSAMGPFYVPLATHEGALVASYHRGARAISLSGGARSVCLTEGVQRSPLFKFDSLVNAGKFCIWIAEQEEKFKSIIAEESRFAKLIGIEVNVEGNHVILTLDYSTGDAAGQNMVTICSQAIVDYINRECPIPSEYNFVESNYSGDKKASAVSFSKVRGKKVTTEVVLPKEIVEKVLKSTPQKMHEYWLSSTIAVVQSGAIGAQGHYANGLAAMFIACGQDAACISEASVGVTRMEVNKNGDLYACITIPNLIVGTIGGGTHLPTQKECLSMMGCLGEGKARKFAEICGGVVLAGELSIAAALSVDHFTRAHKKLGRKNGK